MSEYHDILVSYKKDKQGNLIPIKITDLTTNSSIDNVTQVIYDMDIDRPNHICINFYGNLHTEILEEDEK